MISILNKSEAFRISIYFVVNAIFSIALLFERFIQRVSDSKPTVAKERDFTVYAGILSLFKNGLRGPKDNCNIGYSSDSSEFHTSTMAQVHATGCT